MIAAPVLRTRDQNTCGPKLKEIVGLRREETMPRKICFAKAAEKIAAKRIKDGSASFVCHTRAPSKHVLAIAAKSTVAST